MKIVNLFIGDFMDSCNVVGFGKIILPIETKIHIWVEMMWGRVYPFFVNKDGHSSTWPGSSLGWEWGRIIN